MCVCVCVLCVCVHCAGVCMYVHVCMYVQACIGVYACETFAFYSNKFSDDISFLIFIAKMTTLCSYEIVPQFSSQAQSITLNAYSVYLPTLLLIVFYTRLLAIARKQV